MITRLKAVHFKKPTRNKMTNKQFSSWLHYYYLWGDQKCLLYCQYFI